MLENTDELILEPELHEHKESIDFSEPIELISGMGVGFYVINRDPENTFQFNSTVTRKGYGKLGIRLGHGLAIYIFLVFGFIVKYI